MAMRSMLSELLEPVHVVPHLEQPQPGLARVAAGLVHHAPLVAGQVLGGRQAVVVVAVGEEQQRLGEVGAVELALGERSVSIAPLRARVSSVASMTGTGP